MNVQQSEFRRLRQFLEDCTVDEMPHCDHRTDSCQQPTPVLTGISQQLSEAPEFRHLIQGMFVTITDNKKPALPAGRIRRLRNRADESGYLRRCPWASGYIRPDRPPRKCRSDGMGESLPDAGLNDREDERERGRKAGIEIDAERSGEVGGAGDRNAPD
ncbi:MAG TPA: hypothetical protein PLP98_11995, partial [Plasticicumulans sp.]|nr:hypothetical protein [Plasticicumulans sp.]